MMRYGLHALAVLVALLCLGCPPPQLPPPPPQPKPVAKPKPPPPDPAPIADGDVTVAYANGMRILVKHLPEAELVSTQLYIKGGARFRNKQNAGLEQLALVTAANGGTKRLDKQAYVRKLSALGSDISASSSQAYSSLSAKSLTGSFDETFQLLSEVFLTPALPDRELEISRSRQIAGIKQREVTPDGRLSLLVIEHMYKDHPYENLPDGTVESVSTLTGDMVAEHLQTLRETSRLELVVVGNVTAAHVRELALRYFGKLPRGNYVAQPFRKPSFTKPNVEIIEAQLPTNYIEASFFGPGWDEPDFAASILTMRMLSRRLFDEVRTKRNLSYAPSARHAWSGEIARGSLYVTAVKANTTLQVMHDEARKMQTTLVGQKELTGAKSVFVTAQLMSNESTSGQASWLAICDIVGGDWKLSRTLIERVKAVTPEQVQAFAKKHIGNLQTIVIGDPNKIDSTLFEAL